MGLILDSTVLIGGEREGLTVVQTLKRLRSRKGDQEIAVSVMTAAELIHGVWRADSAATRARREEFVEEVLLRVPVLPVTLRIARIAAQVDATCRAKGKVVPTADLFIGATALERNFGVLTLNVRHFRLIPGLRVAQAV